MRISCASTADISPSRHQRVVALGGGLQLLGTAGEAPEHDGRPHQRQHRHQRDRQTAGGGVAEGIRLARLVDHEQLWSWPRTARARRRRRPTRTPRRPVEERWPIGRRPAEVAATGRRGRSAGRTPRRVGATRGRRIAGQNGQAVDLQHGSGRSRGDTFLERGHWRVAFARGRDRLSASSRCDDATQAVVGQRPDGAFEGLCRDGPMPLEVAPDGEEHPPPLRRRHLGTHTLDVAPALEGRPDQRQSKDRVDERLRPAHTAQRAGGLGWVGALHGCGEVTDGAPRVPVRVATQIGCRTGSRGIGRLSGHGPADSAVARVRDPQCARRARPSLLACTLAYASHTMLPMIRHHDDAPVGRILARREVLALFGTTAGVALLGTWAPGRRAGRAAFGLAEASAATPACVVRPELTEGPYFVDERLESLRHPLRSGHRRRPGPARSLTLTFAVSRIDGDTCIPFEGALVDLWHCDAARRLLRRLGRRLQHGRPEVPARLPADRRRRRRALRHHLPGLVPGPHGPHPLQDPHGSGQHHRARVHLAAVLRRRPDRRRPRPATVRRQGSAHAPQRRRRHLRRQRRRAGARARRGRRRRLRRHVRDRCRRERDDDDHARRREAPPRRRRSPAEAAQPRRPASPRWRAPSPSPRLKRAGARPAPPATCSDAQAASARSSIARPARRIAGSGGCSPGRRPSWRGFSPPASARQPAARSASRWLPSNPPSSACSSSSELGGAPSPTINPTAEEESPWRRCIWRPRP